MKIVFCTGAGLSAESGISTFRDAGGLWHKHSIEEVCDLKNFYKNYDKVHDFYNLRRLELAKIKPNAAHLKIAELSSNFDIVNLTTNVDSLLEIAGCKDVTHLHGVMTELIQDYGTDKESVIDVGYNEVNYLDITHYPLKPNVIFFNEFAPAYKIFSEEIKRLENSDIVIITGSSEQVFPFVDTIKYELGFRGKVVFVNPDENLCKIVKNNGVIVHQMYATEFFTKIETYIPELSIHCS